jgi:hypothetical protein
MSMDEKISILFPYRNISILFDQKDTDAQACRDIISWHVKSVKKKGDSVGVFRLTELGNWLLENHLPFKEEYVGSHIPKSYRLHSKRTYIQNRLEELIRLNLIEKKGIVKASKNAAETPLYSFTQIGYIFAWLLEAKYSTEDNRSRTIEMFFRELSSYINTSCGASSAVDISTNFFKRCVEEGVHTRINDDYLNMFINFLPMSDGFLPQHFLRFLRHFILFGLYANQECAKIFLKLIEESDEVTRDLILLQLKLDIESYYNDGMGATVEWEMERHEFINDPAVVVVQGYCVACKLKTVFMIRLLDFLKMGGPGHAPACSLNGEPVDGDPLPDTNSDRRIGILFRVLSNPYCNIKRKGNVPGLVPILYVPPRYLSPHILSPEYMEHILNDFFAESKGASFADLNLKIDNKESTN